jgi:hypothetical protein
MKTAATLTLALALALVGANARAETFQWTPPSTCDSGYAIEVQLPGGEWWYWTTVRGPSFTVTGQPGVTVRFRVRAFDSAATASGWSWFSQWHTFGQPEGDGMVPIECRDGLYVLPTPTPEEATP